MREALIQVKKLQGTVWIAVAQIVSVSENLAGGTQITLTAGAPVESTEKTQIILGRIRKARKP